MEIKEEFDCFRAPVSSDASCMTSNLSANESYASNDSFLIPAVPSLTSKMSIERIHNARKLMQLPSPTTNVTPQRSDSIIEINFNTDSHCSSQEIFSTPRSSGTRDVLRDCSMYASPSFPDNFPLSGSSEYVSGPPGGTPFPRHKTSPKILANLSLDVVNRSPISVKPPILNLSEGDWETNIQTDLCPVQSILSDPTLLLSPDQSHIQCDHNGEYETPSHYYLNSSIVLPPVPFNSPVTPGFFPATAELFTMAKEGDDMAFTILPSENIQNQNSDIDDSKLLEDLCNAAAKQEEEDKIRHMAEKHDKHRIFTGDHSLEELLNEMPIRKDIQGGSMDCQYLSEAKRAKREERKIRQLTEIPKPRVSNKYTHLTAEEVERISLQRRVATEYKGAMTTAQKEIVRRGNINDCLSMLRKIIPGISDSTENTEVYEITARYVAFLKEKTEGKHDRNYLYENLEL